MGNYTLIILLCYDSPSPFSKNQSDGFQMIVLLFTQSKTNNTISYFLTVPEEKCEQGPFCLQTYSAFRGIPECV